MEAYQQDTGRRIASAVKSTTWILGCQLFVFAALALYVSRTHGSSGVLVALAAGLICFLPAVTALFCVAMTAGTPNALSGTLLSMVLRTALPFFVTILLVQASPWLADTGLFAMVLINYLVVLAVESAVAVRMDPNSRCIGGAIK